MKDRFNLKRIVEKQTGICAQKMKDSKSYVEFPTPQIVVSAGTFSLDYKKQVNPKSSALSAVKH